MSSFASSFRYGDSLTIILISISTAILCETISYFLIYRNSTYKSLKSFIKKSSKKLDPLKSTTTPKSKPSKKLDRVETNLKTLTRDLSLTKFKSGAVMAAVLFGLLNSMFEGRVVAKLPFQPVGFVRKMSHRGLVGDDATDCSMVFLYFLCSVSFRTNLQKFLGFSPPRGAPSAGGLFPTPDPKMN